MSGCTNEGPFNGGTYNDIIANNPTINGGTLTGSELSNVILSNNITVSDSIAEQLAAAMCEYVKDCVEFPAEDVAAVFNDCGGKAHVPGAQLPTCEEMNAAITTAMIPNTVTAVPTSTTDASVPTVIVGEGREQLLGKPHAYIQWGDFLIPAYAKA